MDGIFYHFTYMCDKIKNERDKIQCEFELSKELWILYLDKLIGIKLANDDLKGLEMTIKEDTLILWDNDENKLWLFSVPSSEKYIY